MWRLLLIALLPLSACKGSGVPWKHISAELEEGGRVSITVNVNLTGTGSFGVEMEGPAYVVFTRKDGTTVKRDMDEAPMGPPALATE